MPAMSVEERAESGRALRKVVARSAHGEWAPDPDRPDPVTLLEEQNATRVPWLVPVRHARMRVSPFTFFRGAARIMASDLASTPSSGLTVQLGGDAHLANFGAYASPERQLVFDQNDFDETLPGPWEWDLKRLAASVTIAAQHRRFSRDHTRRITSIVTKAYRTEMAKFATMGYLELWYEHVTIDDVRSAGAVDPKELNRQLDRFQSRAQRRTSLQALKKLTVEIDGHHRIRHDPPLLLALRDLPAEYDPAGMDLAARSTFEQYKESLADHRRMLLDRYTLVDVGVKVVGVGSVGTRALVLLLQGRDRHDALFMQAKEADESVLERHLGPSRYVNHGRRVVEGQRLVQAESDSFLGWAEGEGPDQRHFYFRQLRDWKGSIEVDDLAPKQLAFYAGLCGTTLARGHARSTDAQTLSAYLGRGETLDRAITAFAARYADQNLEDFGHFCEAIDAGRLPAST